jgi:carboxymethylenebutenolidase
MPGGQDVEYASNGTTTHGYLATPDVGRGPGLIVIQEWWGLNDQIRRTADRFASEGFVALAPDFYHGKLVNIGEPDEAGKLLMALNIDQAGRDARGAAQYLLQRAAALGGKVGVIGFCMGGQLALLAGTVAADEISAVVNMYGIHPNVKPDFSTMKAPVLGLFAELDGFVNEDARKALRDEIRKAGVRYTDHTYPGVDHAFMNDDRPEVYNAQAAQDAWDRVIAFFRKELAA